MIIRRSTARAARTRDACTHHVRKHRMSTHVARHVLLLKNAARRDDREEGDKDTNVYE